MSRFSERFGFVKAPLDLGLDEMPPSLRNGLWDAIRLYYFNGELEVWRFGDAELAADFDLLTRRIWFSFLRESLDNQPERARDIVREMMDRFYGMKFFTVYDFLEHLAQLDDTHFSTYDRSAFAEFCNTVLERERAAFRFAGTTLVQIANVTELSSISDSLEQTVSSAVQAHIKRAAELYSDAAPDYRNSIKESISSVEAAVRFITGKKTVGVAKGLRSAVEELFVHPALRDGFEKLYAYTSDENGIRHSLLEDGKAVTQEDARYMLVSCSAFANYLLALRSRMK